MSKTTLFIASLLAACQATTHPSASDDAAVTATSGRLRAVDVTFVYPLPPAPDVPALPAPSDIGRGGPLLPPEALNGGMPELDERDRLGSDAARWASLRAVAVRFDPCPGTTSPPSSLPSCTPDLRIVFQSLEPGAPTKARDGAVHAFYTLTRPAFAIALRELRALRASDPSGAAGRLDVHPRLVAEGVRGEFAQRLHKLILDNAGPESLVRVTHFRRVDSGGFGQKWSFRIRDKRGGAWADSTIATTSVTEQSALAIVGGRWDADVTPSLTHADDVTRLFKVQQSEEAAAFRATVRVLNPRVHSSESVDCATCHLAPDVAGFANATRHLSVGSYPERFVSNYPTAAATLSDDDAIAFENIHMLSYLDTTLSVSPRVANETAAILEVLDTGAFD